MIRRTGLLVMVVIAAMGVGACKRSSTVVIKDPGPAQRQEALRLVEEAAKATEAGDSAKAIRLYEESLNHSQEFAIAWHNLAMLYVKRGQVGDLMRAAEMLENSIALEPDRPDSYYCMGLIYADGAQPDKALQYFKLALERDRLHLPSLRGVAKVGRERFIADKETLEWMKTALLVETNPAWRRIFEDEKLRIEGAMHGAGTTGKL